MRVNRLNEMEIYVLSRGSATLQELADRFGVSINSVRRDVSSLLERGTVKKVYGGVAAKESGIVYPSQLRQNFHQEEKRQIGQLAAEFVPDNALIYLDSGTTVSCILPYLAGKTGVTILTNSLLVEREIEKYPNLELLCLGGRLNRVTSSLSGLLTLDAINTFNIPLAFMAVTGVSPEYGLCNTTESEAQVKRAVVGRSQKVILMADHNKFTKGAILPYYSFGDLYAVVTDRELEEPFAEIARQQEIIVSTPAQPYRRGWPKDTL